VNFTDQSLQHLYLKKLITSSNTGFHSKKTLKISGILALRIKRSSFLPLSQQKLAEFIHTTPYSSCVRTQETDVYYFSLLLLFIIVHHIR
jgi:hypothetical protein